MGVSVRNGFVCIGGVQTVAKHGSSEDKIYARLRELTDATRQVRKELEELIKRPHRDHSRSLAHDESAERRPPPKPREEDEP